MNEPFFMLISEIQPSQLYINRAKLDVLRELDDTLKDHLYEPIPIKRLDGQVIYSDGHTRALAVFLNGGEEVKVIQDSDELDWDAYRICVNWCIENGIRTVKDLRERLLEPADYERLWIKRCQQINCRNQRRYNEFANC